MASWLTSKVRHTSGHNLGAPDVLEFEMLMKQFQPVVNRMLHRLVGPQDHVSDLSQEIFMRLYRALPHFRGDSQVSTFLYRIVINVVKDDRRRRLKDYHTLSPLSDTQKYPSHVDQTVTPTHVRLFGLAMEEALALLEDNERIAFLLYHQENLRYKDIATVMDIPLNSVKTCIHRAKYKLQAMLKERLVR